MTLLTGASGFLGQIILKAISGKVTTLGRIKLNGDHIISDLQSVPDIKKRYDLVIHNAGKAHMVPKTPVEIETFFNVNLEGTKFLLEALSSDPPRVFVFISTVAVYGLEEGENISEKKEPSPNTPYGESKWLAEKMINKWASDYNVKAFIFRLPLVAGKNPPGNLGSIKKAIQKGYYFKIKNNTARKSMVLAGDIADLILSLPSTKSGTYNLTDGVHPSFNSIEAALEIRTKKRALVLSLKVVKVLAYIGDTIYLLGIPSPLTSTSLRKIITTLTFDDNKARRDLGWSPKPVLSFLKNEL